MAFPASVSGELLHKNGFTGKIIPDPTDDCFVCFYEEAHFHGGKSCVGKRNTSSTELNPLGTEAKIGSIKFGTGCDLVVNTVVADPPDVSPYGSHVDMLSNDVFNYTRNDVLRVYVEEAGTACFTGSNTLSLGNCYTSDEADLGPEYDRAFMGGSELFLFQTLGDSFGVTVYENKDYNGGGRSNVKASVDFNSTARSFRFSSYSKDLTYSTKGGEKISFPVRSIAFISDGEEEVVPASVVPSSS